MVTENVDQLSFETTDSPVDTGVVEADTSPQEAVEAPQAEAEGLVDTAQAPPVQAPPAQAPPEPAGIVPPASSAPPPQYTPEQIAQMQAASNQYAQVQQRAALQGQVDNYKQQLENAGYLPEHAEQSAATYMQGLQQHATVVQQAEEWGREVEGRGVYAEQFAKKYNLGIDDLETLRRYGDAASVENAAKKIAADRERDSELARFRQAQVPAQSFDNSQGNPQVAADEGGWLDRYNSGDRSPSAQSAARKAAGLA